MNNTYTAALDVGEQRIGIAVANNQTKLATPLATLKNDETFTELLLALIREHKIDTLVVGLPRGMEGQETAQTRYTRDFSAKLETVIDVPLHLQDEAGTSLQAKQELDAKGKPYVKEAVDALAATYILQDFMNEKYAETANLGNA